MIDVQRRPKFVADSREKEFDFSRSRFFEAIECLLETRRLVLELPVALGDAGEVHLARELSALWPLKELQ